MVMAVTGQGVPRGNFGAPNIPGGGGGIDALLQRLMAQAAAAQGTNPALAAALEGLIDRINAVQANTPTPPLFTAVPPPANLTGNPPSGGTLPVPPPDGGAQPPSRPTPPTTLGPPQSLLQSRVPNLAAGKLPPGSLVSPGERGLANRVPTLAAPDLTARRARLQRLVGTSPFMGAFRALGR